MAKRHIKSCSSSLIIKEMQIKTMRYHLTAIRMTFIKKITNKKCWRRCVGKRTFIHCWWEYKLVWPLWRTLWKFPKKIKIELYYMMCIPTPGHIFRGKKMIWKDMYTSIFIAALLTIPKAWKQPKCASK